MSDYHYGYDTPDDTPSGKKQTENEIFSWILIFFCFTVFWPLGLFLLIRKLTDRRRPEEKQNRTAKSTRTKAAQPAARSTVPPGWSAPGEANAAQKKQENFSQRMVRTPSMRKGTRLAMKIVGAILVVAGVAAAMDVISYLSWPIYNWEIMELLRDCAFAGAGGIMLGKGVQMDRAVKRYANYLAVIGNAQSISFRQLSEITGRPEKKVIRDLEQMIDKNYFGPTAYVDLSLGFFFRSRTAAEEDAAKQRAAAATPMEAEQGYAGVLRDIRSANDRIADAVLSAKIDRLEEVTAQIFRVIEKDEQKERQVRTFLEYYLPTTQKLLDSYAEVEAAGVNGENLRMAKEKIEETMDDIVRGFERQLDALYAAEAMDIQSDIDVMNNMMKRDSAMGTSDFKVSSAAAKAPEMTLEPDEDEGTAAVAMAQEEE